MLTNHFLKKVVICFLLGWSFLGGEHGLASDSFPSLSPSPRVVETSLVDTPEEIQEFEILPQPMTSFLKGDKIRRQTIGKPKSPVLADVYFDEQRLFIDASLKAVLLKTVEWLTHEPKGSLQIEGHCDSRGTAAYNMARANFHLAYPTRYLLLLGGSSHHISRINYGQNPVACRERNESCQENNLRAQHIFSHLAIRHTQRGCLTRLRLVPGQDGNQAIRIRHHLPNLQRIQVASSSSSF